MTVCVLAIFPATSRSQACPSNAIVYVQAGAADLAPLVMLGGNVHPLALPQYDRGPADGGMATGRMTLILKRSAQQDQDLTRFLTDVQNPHSASFRKF
jgi:hypothetical protein